MKHLSLLIHCLCDKNEKSQPIANHELYIQIDDLESFIQNKIQEGYKFCLPFEAYQYPGPSLSFSFDDGQLNNKLFLPLAEKYKIPFIVFISSYYSQNQEPFPWDLSIVKDKKTLMTQEGHKPFSAEELKKVMECKWMYVAPHGHTHKPFNHLSSQEMSTEIEKNLAFLENFPRVLRDDFAFPNGHFTSQSLKWVLRHFKRAYTIEGAKASTSELIHRVSLINPKYGGDFEKQINRTKSLRFRLARKYVRIKANLAKLYKQDTGTAYDF